MLVKDLLLGLSGFVIAFVVYDKYDSGISKLAENKRLEGENKALRSSLIVSSKEK